MAEKAVGGPEADDLFALGGNYHAQTSDKDETSQLAVPLDAVGDPLATDTYGAMTPVSVPYIYNSTSPMWDADATNAALKTLPRPGQVKGGYMITKVDVAYTNSGDLRPRVTVTGHNHAVNAHDTDGAIYSPTIDVKGGVGCPGLFVNTDSDGSSAPTSESYSIECEHVDVDNGAGNHLAGWNFHGKESYGADYTGTPTLTVPAGFKRTSRKSTTANTDADKQSLAYEHHIARDS